MRTSCRRARSSSRMAQKTSYSDSSWSSCRLIRLADVKRIIEIHVVAFIVLARCLEPIALTIFHAYVLIVRLECVLLCDDSSYRRSVELKGT